MDDINSDNEHQQCDNPSSQWVSPSFTDFLKSAGENQILRKLQTESNFMDTIANMFIRTKQLLDGSEGCELKTNEEEIWENCRLGGWKKTIFQSVQSLRDRVQDSEQKEVFVNELRCLLQDSYLGPAYHKFIFVLIVELAAGISSDTIHETLLDTSSACTSLYPHDGLYFGVWMYEVALLKNTTTLLNTSQNRCRTVVSVLDTCEQEYYKDDPNVILGLSRLLLECGELDALIEKSEEFLYREGVELNDFSAGFLSHLMMLQCTARLRIGGSEEVKNVTKVIKLLNDPTLFRITPITIKYATPILLELKRCTSDTDAILIELSDRLLSVKSSPCTSASIDLVVSYCFLLMLSGRGREASIYMRKCRQCSSDVSATDYPRSGFPTSSKHDVVDVGCQLYTLEIFSAYMKAFYLHNELIRTRRSLKKVQLATAPGDRLLNSDPFEKMLNVIHEFFSCHIFWSDLTLGTPQVREEETLKREIPKAVIQHADHHIHISTLTGNIRSNKTEILSLPDKVKSNYNYERCAYNDIHVVDAQVTVDDIQSVSIERLTVEYADLNLQSEPDNNSYDIGMGSSPELVLEHFSKLDSSCRGFIHLRTAVTTIRRYLSALGTVTSVRGVIQLLLPFLDNQSPSFIDYQSWSQIYYEMQRWEAERVIDIE